MTRNLTIVNLDTRLLRSVTAELYNGGVKNITPRSVFERIDHCALAAARLTDILAPSGNASADVKNAAYMLLKRLRTVLNSKKKRPKG